MIINDALRSTVITIMKENMALKEGEKILIVNDVPGTDEWSKPFTYVVDVVRRSLLAKQFFDVTSEQFPLHLVDYLTYYTIGQHGKEPPEDVGKRMAYYDVVICINSYSISHTTAREFACSRGARVASLPEILPEMFLPNGPLDVDYGKMQSDTITAAKVLTEGNKVRIAASNGTELYFTISGREGRTDTGLIHEKGKWGNLPGGEAYVAPVEGTTFGKLVVSTGFYPGLEHDMIFVFEEGEVTKIVGGGKVGNYFRNILNLSSQDLKFKRRRNCAEFGIGTNPNAKRADNVLEAEKMKGTIHIAVGDNSHFGGVISSDIHEDFIVNKPDVCIDGVYVMKEGKAFWEV